MITIKIYHNIDIISFIKIMDKGSENLATHVRINTLESLSCPRPLEIHRLVRNRLIQSQSSYNDNIIR